VGELFGRRLSLELDLEPPSDPVQLLLAFADVDGDTDRVRVVGERTLHGLAYPPGRVGGELVTTAPVELLDRAGEPECPLLDQVEERDAETAKVDPALIAHHCAEAGLPAQAVRINAEKNVFKCMYL